MAAIIVAFLIVPVVVVLFTIGYCGSPDIAEGDWHRAEDMVHYWLQVAQYDSGYKKELAEARQNAEAKKERYYKLRDKDRRIP